jgi:hypothetical protein
MSLHIRVLEATNFSGGLSGFYIHVDLTNFYINDSHIAKCLMLKMDSGCKKPKQIGLSLLLIK